MKDVMMYSRYGNAYMTTERRNDCDSFRPEHDPTTPWKPRYSVPPRPNRKQHLSAQRRYWNDPSARNNRNSRKSLPRKAFRNSRPVGRSIETHKWNQRTQPLYYHAASRYSTNNPVVATTSVASRANRHGDARNAEHPHRVGLAGASLGPFHGSGTRNEVSPQVSCNYYHAVSFHHNDGGNSTRSSTNSSAGLTGTTAYTTAAVRTNHSTAAPDTTTRAHQREAMIASFRAELHTAIVKAEQDKQNKLQEWRLELDTAVRRSYDPEWPYWLEIWHGEGASIE